MATITPRSPARVAESQRKVRHPLERLRHYIRLYVSLEGATVLVLYLALWFWIGLALDYGAFKVFSIDWAQEELPYKFQLGPWQLPVFRTGLLVALLAGLLAVVAFKVVVRLLRDFRDTSLALLLERRFPELLGDRLITAVELADVRSAARYGYSPEMIEETIIEAADRVDRAPVQEVFNWRRLANRGVVVGILLIGVYLVVGGAACLWELFAEHRASAAGFANLTEVSGTWVERNVLLRDTLWPRRAFLELVGFPASGELRIGQEAPPPTLRARALKWIVHDPKAPDTWRALTWQDLKDHPEYLGGDAPPALPAAWLAQRDDWTVDQIELQLGKQEVDRQLAVRAVLEKLERLADAPDGSVRKNPPAAAGARREPRWVFRAGNGWRSLTWNDVAGLADRVGEDGKVTDLPAGWAPPGGTATVDEVDDRLATSGLDDLARLRSDLLDRLDRVAESRRYRERLRKVVIPDTVYAISRGPTTYNTITLQKTGDNEYAGTFTDLKESVRFTVRGEDYFTPYRRITVVPPPTLRTLTRDEYRPAYLYYRVPADSTADDLRTRKQAFLGNPNSLAGSDTTRIDVPYGTDVVLTAEVDKPLRRKDPAEGVEDGVRILPPRKGVAPVRAKVELLDDHTFRSRFDDVRSTLDLVFEFTDTDGVVGLRHVVIKAKPDTPPDVDAQVETIRKTNQGYMITPFALVPFSGKVRDDHGLNEVNFVCTLTQVDSQGEGGGKALLLMGALPGLGGGLAGDLVTAAQLAALAQLPDAPAGSAEPEVLPVPAFVDALAQRAPREVLPQKELLRFLPLSGDRPFEETAGATKRQFQHPVMTRSLLSELTLEPERPESSFDLLKLTRGPKIAGEREFQPHYRMQLWVEGVDNDLLTGPHRTQSKEKFTFRVVSVNDLLSEIAKEEESLHLKLDDMVGRLREGRSKLEQVVGDLGMASPKPEQFAPMSVRSEEIEQIRDRAETATGEVLRDYQRILKEMDLNRVQRVQPNLITRVEKTIATPLDDILRTDFPKAKDGLDELRRVLDAKEADVATKAVSSRKAAVEAQARLDILIQDLSAVLNSMEGLTNINSLIKKLRDLEEAERAQFDLLDQLRKQIRDRDFNDLFGDEKKPEQKK